FRIPVVFAEEFKPAGQADALDSVKAVTPHAAVDVQAMVPLLQPVQGSSERRGKWIAADHDAVLGRIEPVVADEQRRDAGTSHGDTAAAVLGIVPLAVGELAASPVFFDFLPVGSGNFNLGLRAGPDAEQAVLRIGVV